MEKLAQAKIQDLNIHFLDHDDERQTHTLMMRHNVCIINIFRLSPIITFPSVETGVLGARTKNHSVCLDSKPSAKILWAHHDFPLSGKSNAGIFNQVA